MGNPRLGWAAEADAEAYGEIDKRQMNNFNNLMIERIPQSFL